MKKLILSVALMATISMMFSCTPKKASKDVVTSDSTVVDSLGTVQDSLSTDSSGFKPVMLK